MSARFNRIEKGQMQGPWRSQVGGLCPVPIARRTPGELLAQSSDAWRRRSALLMTETELKLIAAAAIIGLSRMPKTG